MEGDREDTAQPERHNADSNRASKRRWRGGMALEIQHASVDTVGSCLADVAIKTLVGSRATAPTHSFLQQTCRESQLDAWK